MTLNLMYGRNQRDLIHTIVHYMKVDHNKIILDVGGEY